MSYVPGAMATGAAAGGLGGGMLGQAIELLQAPRRGLWQALGWPDTGTELLEQEFGMDPESGLTQALGVGAEMLIDPLNLVGAGFGSLGGRAIGKGLDVAGDTLAARRGLQGQLRTADAMQDAASGAMKQQLAPPSAKAFGDMPLDPSAGLRTQYNPVVMQELEAAGLQPTARVFNRVNPDLAQHMDDLGLGYTIPKQAGTIDPAATRQVLSYVDRPSFARGKGGVLRLSGNPADDALLRHQELLVPLDEAAKSPFGTGTRAPFPSVAEALPDSPYLDEVLAGTRFGELPLDQSVLASAANQAGIQQQLRQLGNPGVLERLLGLFG